MGRRYIMIGVGIAIIVTGCWYALLNTHSAKRPSSNEYGIKVGQTLNGFTLNNLQGSSVLVGETDKIIVIHFWATWCHPCLEEMPELESFSKRNRNKIQFYAINVQESMKEINDFMTKNQYTMTVLLDEDGDATKQFQITDIPTTIIVNKHGMIKYRKPGSMTMNEIEGIVNSL